MASLLDTIRTNLTQQAAPKVGMADEGEKVRKLLGAKTGKASSQASSSIAQSNLGEAAAVDQTRQGQEQLTQQGQVQAQQIGQQQAGLQEQERQGREQVNLQQRANTLQNAIQTDQFLNDLSRDRTSLDLDKDRAQLEQVAQNLAFQDKQYVDNLQRVGDMNRLNDSLAFREQLAKTVFSDSNDILSQDIFEKASTAQSMRDYDKAIFSTRLIDMINSDYDASKAEQQRAKYSGAGQGISAVSQIASMNTSSGTKSPAVSKSPTYTGDVNISKDTRGLA